ISWFEHYKTYTSTNLISNNQQFLIKLFHRIDLSRVDKLHELLKHFRAHIGDYDLVQLVLLEVMFEHLGENRTPNSEYHLVTSEFLFFLTLTAHHKCDITVGFAFE